MVVEEQQQQQVATVDVVAMMRMVQAEPPHQTARKIRRRSAALQVEKSCFPSRAKVVTTAKTMRRVVVVGQEGATVDMGCLPEEMVGVATSVVPRTLVDVLPNRMVVAACLCPRGWKTTLNAGESCSMRKTR